MICLAHTLQKCAQIAIGLLQVNIVKRKLLNELCQLLSIMLINRSSRGKTNSTKGSFSTALLYSTVGNTHAA